MERLVANLLLLLAALFWGFGNIAQKTVLDKLQPFTTIGLRSLIALIVILPFVLHEIRAREDAISLRNLMAPSLCFSLALAAQQIGYGGTTVTNASFLVNTTVLFTPVCGWLLLGDRPPAVSCHP